MATLTIKITAPIAAFQKYADDLGYQANIVTGIDAKGISITAPNPQTQAEYLTEKIKGIVSVALADKTAQAIRHTKEQEARTEVVTARTAIENAMVVTIA